MNSTGNAERYLRTAAAAAYVGLTKSTLEKKRLTGDGPIFSSLNRIVVYSRDDLDNWVASRRRRSTSDPGTQTA